MAKAVILTAGGLDSLLVVKLMQQTDIELIPVHFDIGLTYNKPILAGQRISKYFGLEYLVKNSIEIDKVDIAREFYTNILSDEESGSSNICLEHRIFLLKQAKIYMEEHQADFMVMGDIVDQRPLIQSRKALLYADREADVEGLVFRPLSAALLPSSQLIETYPSLKSICFDFKGFTPAREKLAQKIGLLDYPQDTVLPLRESEVDMGKKAFEMFEKDYFINPAHLHRLGIHFEFTDKAKGIIGRSSFESIYLKQFHQKLKPKQGIAFSIDEPKFLFGFIYGEDICDHHEVLAPQIFCSTVLRSEGSKKINFFNHDGSPLGSKHVSAIHLNEYSKYLQNDQELHKLVCPIDLLDFSKIPI
ncbi:MAG: hypothetical protein ACRCVW_04165 [Brevinema sp.]